MKFVRSFVSAWSLAAILSVGLTFGDVACGGDSGSGGKGGSGDQGGDGGGSSGGKTGGSGGNGSGGKSGGSGGNGSGGNGSGGTSGSGSGGSSGSGSGGNGSGGNAGSTNTGGGGGSAGAPGSGGMIGTLTCDMPPAAGTPDPQIPPNLVLCGPYCIYRPNWPGHHTCGPAGSDLKLPLPALKTDGFCGNQYNQDGVFTISQTKLDADAFNQAATGLTVNNPVPNVSRIYLPGGMAKYSAAADGKVALSFWTGAFVGSQDRFHFENVHEYLVNRGEIPYTIAVFTNIETNGDKGGANLKAIITALKAKYPKISDDPNYRVIAGQSTTGGDAFDIAWLSTDVVAKAIGGSASVVCFTCMGGQQQVPDSYQAEVNFCPPRPIRWSATVGTCDIYDTLEHRIAAGCSADTGAGAVDASQCQADWLTANKGLQAALKAKGTPAQLFVVTGGGHLHETWGVWAMPWQLRWIFKDITCAK